MATIGATILWFGWYGFNPGSTLSGMDFVGIGRVAANTTLAACAAGMVAVLFVYPRSKKWDLGMSLNGFLGGLVAITCPCYWVSPGGAIWIGAIAGIVVPLGVDLLEYLRIDDPIGAVAVHMFAGIWGTLSLGLFATGQFGLPTPTGADNETFTINGLFYGGGADQLKAQFVGSITCVVVVGAVSLILFKVIRAIPGSWNLRIDKEGELEGLDIVEHGSPAYHMEFGQGMTYTTLGAGTFSGGKDAPEKTSVSGGGTGLTAPEVDTRVGAHERPDPSTTAPRSAMNVELVRWPEGAARREGAPPMVVPTLLLVPEGEAPPGAPRAGGLGATPADEVDLFARLQHLEGAGPPAGDASRGHRSSRRGRRAQLAGEVVALPGRSRPPSPALARQRRRARHPRRAGRQRVACGSPQGALARQSHPPPPQAPRAAWSRRTYGAGPGVPARGGA